MVSLSVDSAGEAGSGGGCYRSVQGEALRVQLTKQRCCHRVLRWDSGTAINAFTPAGAANYYRSFNTTLVGMAATQTLLRLSTWLALPRSCAML